MTSSIWQNEDICDEMKFIKRPWYIRDARVMQHSITFEKPALWLQVEKTDKMTLPFGPVIAIGLAHYTKGRGKDKEVKEALNILTLTGEKGFYSVIVALENFKTEASSLYAADPVLLEACELHDKKSLSVDWFSKFVADTEEMLLPHMQARYKRFTGKEYRRVLKLKMVTQKTTSDADAPKKKPRSKKLVQTILGGASSADTRDVEQAVDTTGNTLALVPFKERTGGPGESLGTSNKKQKKQDSKGPSQSQSLNVSKRSLRYYALIRVLNVNPDRVIGVCIPFFIWDVLMFCRMMEPKIPRYQSTRGKRSERISIF